MRLPKLNASAVTLLLNKVSIRSDVCSCTVFVAASSDRAIRKSDRESGSGSPSWPEAGRNPACHVSAAAGRPACDAWTFGRSRRVHVGTGRHGAARAAAVRIPAGQLLRAMDHVEAPATWGRWAWEIACARADRTPTS